MWTGGRGPPRQTCLVMSWRLSLKLHGALGWTSGHGQVHCSGNKQCERRYSSGTHKGPWGSRAMEKEDLTVLWKLGKGRKEWAAGSTTTHRPAF